MGKVTECCGYAFRLLFELHAALYLYIYTHEVSHEEMPVHAYHKVLAAIWVCSGKSKDKLQIGLNCSDE